MMGNEMGFGMLFGMVSGVILLVGIVFLIVWAVWGPMGKGSPEPNKTAMEILKKRYAQGEISMEEFEERKKDLL